MKRYDNRVLNRLIDSYENSSAYAAERRSSREAAAADTPLHRRGIFCRIDKKTFPEYHDTASGAYETIHDQLMELENKGLIRLYWRNGVKGHILEKVALEVCNAEECYKYLGRVPRREKEERIIGICRKYRMLYDAGPSDLQRSDAEAADNIGILMSFLDWTEHRLDSGESIKRFVDIDDPSGFDRACRLLYAILTNDRDIYLRQFSVELFSDSKIAEKELEKAVAAIKEFSTGGNDDTGDDSAAMSSDELLEKYGVYRNPVWIYMKGHASVRIGCRNGEIADRVSLQSLENGIGFTLRDLSLIKADPSDAPECVMTVENLTSYYQQETQVSGMKAVIIYLGGFAGRQKLEFLRGLRNTYPEARFMHYGDIDCGGFRIWKSLCTGTGIAFETYKMDAETFRRFAGSGRPLTDTDRKGLGTMMDDPFFADQQSLFALMLEAGIKLEQESFAE